MTTPGGLDTSRALESALELIAHAGKHDIGDAIVREFGSCRNSKFYSTERDAALSRGNWRVEPSATTAPKRR
jgi:hypothetical protein